MNTIMSGLGFHVLIASAWALVVIAGTRGRGATIGASVSSALITGLIVFALSVATAQVDSVPAECIEYTPSGTGTC